MTIAAATTQLYANASRTVASTNTVTTASPETTTAMSEQTLMYIVIPASVIVGVPLLITALVAFVSCVCSICKRRKRHAGCCCCYEAATTSDTVDKLDKRSGDGGVSARKANSVAPTRQQRDGRRRADDSAAAVKQPNRQPGGVRGLPIEPAASGAAVGRRNSLTQGWDF